MATTLNTAPKTAKEKKAPIDLVTRTKTQLSQAALKGKVSVDELSALEQHINKLKALLA